LIEPFILFFDVDALATDCKGFFYLLL